MTHHQPAPVSAAVAAVAVAPAGPKALIEDLQVSLG
jgi:hypothetical protein